MTSRIIDDPTSAGWVETSPGFWKYVTGPLVEEAPEDSKQYARQDAAWSEVVIPEVPEFVETDPTVPAHVKGITQEQITSWDTEFVETDPTVPEHVKSISTGDIANWNSVQIEDGTQENQIAHWHSDSGKWIGVANVAVSDSGRMSIGATSARTILHLLDGSPEITFENASGVASKIGINSVDNTMRVTTDLEVSGNVTALDLIATSDRREKKNIATAPVGIIDQIRGVEYEWKTSGKMGSGVIAQELEEIPGLAHLVHESDDGTKHVSYLGLIGYLIEEVKAMKSKIEAPK
jgi:hypothetical protein